ncbi:MAG: serine/threonine-protein kinase [Planctomycetota bacterium]
MTSDKTQFQSPGDRRRALELSQQPTKPPTEVPGYEPRTFLGAGAYGEVWVALDRNTGRKVAIKFFAQSSGIDWSLLKHEVEKLVALSADRYIVQLLDVGWDSNPPYYVMEYIENGSLEDRLKDGPMSVAQSVDVFGEIAIGLSHAHAKGILHCDLKPANILLDQDEKPRLADFGQSRLADEQRPALGTLFYMAPEQADMNAVPDTRWDVYALGAVLYCMLTGAPPHRSGTAISEIDSSANLDERLEKYRDFIRQAGAPTEHRKVRGIDRALIEIVDRCLEYNPKKRFPSVLSVINALNDREQARTRRPLQILGVLGPLLLLLVTSIFGFRAYERATSESEESLIASTFEANRFAAEAVARNVANELDKRFRAVSDMSQNEELIKLMNDLVTDEQVKLALDKFSERKATNGEKYEFVELEQLKPLQEYLNGLLDDPKLPRVASWFATDARGTNIAISLKGANKSTRYLTSSDVRGDNFVHRSYFHGGPDDTEKYEFLPPLKETQLSAPFLSTATKSFKVAISGPVIKEGKTIGVLAMTFELGNFVNVETSEDECAILVDGRRNKFQGLLLQHPLLKKIGAKPTYKIKIDALSEEEVTIYNDPLGDVPGGEGYSGEWIVGHKPVKFERLLRDGTRVDYNTRLIAIVEHRLSAATQPVRQLGTRLFREGVSALALLVGVSLALWYFVIRSLTDSPPLARSFLPSGLSSTSSMHTKETLDMPHAKKSVRQLD